MNTQSNSEVINKLYTDMDTFIPSREQSKASVVYKNNSGEWVGKTQWLFGEKPALANEEPGQWIIELHTRKGACGIVNVWTVMQVYSSGGFECTRFMMFGDFSIREQAAGGASRATSKAIAEAHTIAVQQIERIAAAAVAFYQAKA